jgi:hypothetical protein
MEENKYQPRTEQRINLERKLHAFTSGVDTEDKDASMPIIEENRNAHQNNPPRLLLPTPCAKIRRHFTRSKTKDTHTSGILSVPTGISMEGSRNISYET